MFTGIIESVGTLSSISSRGDSFRIAVADSLISGGSVPGDSVSVNGVCLTVTEISGGTVFFDAVRETVSRTAVSGWSSGIPLNLERAVTPESRLGGHIVQGHVDGTAVLRRIEQNRTGTDLWFTAEDSYLRYIVPKGSVAADGVSLTVAEVSGNDFRVSLIPFTLESTALKHRKSGETVNIETDIIGRYIERLMGFGETGTGLTYEKILGSGFGRRK